MKRKIIYIILCFSLCISLQGNAQDSLSVDAIIKRIAEKQVDKDAFFMQDIFPSYITNKPQFKLKKKDNNSFYNALVGYTLNMLEDELNAGNRQIIDSIDNNSQKLFTHFKNTKGRETYNFWRTDSAYTFPYTWWISLIKKNANVADDLDCTVLCLLVSNTPDSTAAKVHTLMQQFVNNTAHPTKTTSADYKKYGAYSSWFGKNFPVVFDLCVLSNVLTFVQTYDLKWSKADSASLQLIIAALNKKNHIEKPLLVSPYYGRTSIILYHLARLMYVKPIPALEDLKDSLIQQALTAFDQTNDLLEKILLSNALYKWKATPPPMPSFTLKEIEQSDLPFFIGNIPSYLKYTYQKELVKKGIGLFYYYCPAFNDALLAEYLVLKSKAKR